MKITTKTIIASTLIAALLVGMAILAPSQDVMAQADQVQKGVNDIGGGGAAPLTGVVKTIVNTLLFIIGALAVVMIIYGGFKYVTSAGESSAVTSAKNTILYAVIGLIVAILAFAIVNFVIDTFKGTSGNGQPVQQAPKGVGPLPE